MPRRPLPICYRLFSALLALLVLATSVGLTAERHRCRISGRSTVVLVLPGALGHNDGAETPAQPGKPCGNQRPALAKRRVAGCCDISHVLHKLDAKQHASAPAKYLPELPRLPALLPAPAWAGQGAIAPLAAGVAVGTAANSSPPGTPRAGRVLLTLVCTLVV
ncbi:MAG: hypothetical protein ACRYFK_04785 [Janthinobacterium lividum]